MLAIRNEDGKPLRRGFFIGDQTGVGKGRFVAAMLRYGSRKGMVPIFVTVKPALYADMIRDLLYIGMADSHKRILITNENIKGKERLALSDGPEDKLGALAPNPGGLCIENSSLHPPGARGGVGGVHQRRATRDAAGR